MSRAADGPRWIRHRPDPAEQRASLVLAVGVGLAVGATVLYLARLLVAREPLHGAPRAGGAPGERRREGAGA
jgi:hypothetical protein